MKKIIIQSNLNRLLLILLLVLSNEASAQYFPSQEDTLNFTSVAFEFPWIESAESYELLIENRSRKGNIVAQSQANIVRIDGLSFGEDYAWKVRGITAMDEKLPWSTPIVFSIGTSIYTDTNKYRFLGKKLDRSKATKGLLFLDYAHLGINRAGKPIWFLPKMDSLLPNTRVRDLKMTKAGTFTALIGESAIEFDRKGTVLWMAPDDGQVNNESREHYHHEFTKLPNGNYLVLGLDYVMRKEPETTDSMNVEFGTIIEYDKNGKIVWLWNSNDYFTDEDLFSRPHAVSYDVRTHMNACTVSENEVFVGFRNIGRIVVIDRKTGKAKESYGGYGVFSEPHAGTTFFRRQHDALELSDGNLAVLNNDSIMDPDVVSSVVIFSRMQNGTSEKLMDFKLNFDDLTNGKTARTGNLNELENGNLLVNFGSINRCIELTRSEEVVWSMFFEQKDERTQQWKHFPQYRVSHANTMYPYLFTSKLVRNSRNKRNRKIEISVYNVGSSDDTYVVSLMKKGRIVKKKTIEIRSEASNLIGFQLKRKSKYEIHVTSVNLSESNKIGVPGFK